MKETDFLKIINNTLTNSKYIGDDCADLSDLDIFVTQDTLVEDVHFSMYTTTPYLLGRKSVNVNLSDLAAALSMPKYITVSLSVPNTTEDEFISELYRGINDVCNEHNVTVIGGDITGGEKTVISVTAIGKRISLHNSSRKNAKKGDYVLVTGYVGDSSAGLHSLTDFLRAEKKLLDAHLNPSARVKQGIEIANITDSDITVMDTSDGLCDALYKISQASRHAIEIDYDKLPVSQELKDYVKRNGLNTDDFVLWGGEDYELVLCVPEDIYKKLNDKIYTCIGRVINKDLTPSVLIRKGEKTLKITQEIFEKKSFNHFKGELC